MTPLMLDLPPQLAEAFEAHAIDEAQAKHIALSALEITVEQGILPLPSASSPGAAANFARNLIARNRALFEELAQR